MEQEAGSELQRWRLVATEGLSAGIVAAADAMVRAYPKWTTRDLAVHVIRVYSNAALALREGSLERPRPEVAVTRESDPEALAAALREALDAAEIALEGCRHDVVWTPVGPRAPWFWGRRLLREAVLHRWDVEQARGVPAPVAEEYALVLIDEFLDTDVTRALTAGEHEHAGVVAIQSGARAWWVDLTRGAIDVDVDVIGEAATATISGQPAALWLWLMRRDQLPSPVSIDDSNGSASAFTDLIDRFNPPTG